MPVLNMKCCDVVYLLVPLHILQRTIFLMRCDITLGKSEVFMYTGLLDV